MTAPVFSVVIPTRGRPVALNACIGSIAELDYPRNRFEVLVVLDGDENPAPALPEGLSVRILRQKQSGPAVARNYGAREARGEFLAFTDDDCKPGPQWLASLEQTLRAAEGCGAGGRVVNALARNLYATASQLLVEFLYLHYNTPAEARFLTSNNMAFPRQAFLDAGAFDESFPLAAAEDRELCLRWVQQGRPLLYNADAVIHHFHSMSFRGYLRQHFRYGRGASRLREVLRESGAGKIRIESFRFYRDMLTYPWTESHRAEFRLSALLATAQASNIAGFFWERTRR